MGTIKDFQNDPLAQYLRKTALAESGGNDSAKNPTSTAVGKYQFIEGTWKDMVKKYNLGYTLEDRKDPNKSEKVMRLFTQENENILKPVIGRELTDGDRYLAHFLGAYGARNLYKVDPNTPVNTLFSENVLNSNRSIMFNKDGSPKTAQDIKNWAGSKMGSNVEETDWDSQKVELPQPKTGELSYLADTSLFTNFTAETQQLQDATRQKASERQFILDLIGKSQVEYVEPETYMQDGGTWKRQQTKVKEERDSKLRELLKDKDVVKKLEQEAQQRRQQLPTERTTTQVDATKTARTNNPDKTSLTARNKTDKEIAEERQARIDAQTQANAQPFDWSNFRQSLADRSQATGDALRVSNEPNLFDDYLNPASMIGSMADNLGQAPLRAKEEDSFMPYVTAVGAPLTVGAMAGIGTQNTGQFVNNLANPLAGTGDIVNNLGNKYLPNAHKLNPNAFATKEGRFYRQVDDETFQEGVESGMIRGKQDVGFRGVGEINLNRNFGDLAYYNKNALYYPDNSKLPYLYESSHTEDFFTPMVNNRTRGLTRENTNVRVSNTPLKTSDPLIATYKSDWLQGYKPIDNSLGNPSVPLYRVTQDEQSPQFEQGGEIRFIEDLLNNKIPVSKDGVFASGGKPVIVPSSNISLKNVPYPILGTDNQGNSKMMMPGQDYQFPGDYVFEIPQK